MQIASFIATPAHFLAACALLCQSTESIRQAVGGCTMVEAGRVTDRLAAARPGTPPPWFSGDTSLGRFVCLLDDGHVLAWAVFGAGTPPALVAWYNTYSGHVLWGSQYEETYA